jgi:hypothetical protein
LASRSRAARIGEEGSMACRVCGCTDDNACPGGCFWVEPDLCSSCEPVARAALGLDDPFFADEESAPAPAGDCPGSPLGLHQVLWTDGASGYCVRCRAPVHG